jgi:C-terminal processing protease CtpA/Prc
MEDLMRRFRDPYSRHIPETVMMLRQRGIRGETVGIGVVLKRSWHFNELPRAVRGLFLAPTNNFTPGERSSTEFPDQSSEKGCRGSVFSTYNRLVGDDTKLNSVGGRRSMGRNKMRRCYSLFQHVTVSFQTAAPFFLASACQHFGELDILKKAPGNSRVVKVISISIGVMQIIKKLTSIMCPIEVASLQSGGPSVSSGVEIGDQVYFVDGRAVNTLSLKKVNELLSDGEVGDTVNLGIVRTRRHSLTSSSPATVDTINGEYPTREISQTYSNSNEYSSHYSETNILNPAAKASNLFGNTGKEFLLFEITRENVFASRVSSCILSYPSYSDTGSTAKTLANEIGLEEELVASAGILSRGQSENETGGIGYISIGEFTQRTLLEVENALETIKKQLHLAAHNHRNQSFSFNRNKKRENRVSSLCGEEAEGLSSYPLDGLIIDLRGNLGGTLPSALDAASLFLPQGNVLLQMKTIASPAALTAIDTVRNGNGNGNSGSGSGSHTSLSRRGTASFLTGVPFLGKLTTALRKNNDRTERYYSTSKKGDVTTPLLLLVDSHTASASEIFAAALIENNRATCMGSKTLGKNVAQVILDHSFFLRDKNQKLLLLCPSINFT